MRHTRARSKIGEPFRSVLAGVILIAGSSAFAQAAPRRLTVRVYDYVGVPAKVQAEARVGIADIFRRAGVSLDWVDCLASQPTSTWPSQCGSQPVPGLLTAKIITESMAKGLHLSQSAFGLALRGYGAYILYDRIRGHAWAESLPPAPILAIVTAHELGHLLLEAGHSPTGLMAERHQQAQFRDAEKGSWPLFTPGQIAALQRPVQAAWVAAAGSPSSSAN